MKKLNKLFFVLIFFPLTVFAIDKEAIDQEAIDKEVSPTLSPSPEIDVEVEVEIEGQKKALSGEIELEFEKKKVNSYSGTQNSVIEGFREVANRIRQIASKETVEEGSFSKENFTFTSRQLLYFASSYLYCVSKKGTCPYLLDSLLIVDFLALCNDKNGVCRRPKKVSCANMTRMWRSWINNDLEQRLSHNIPIGLMGKYNDFKQNEFSKYLKCSRTLFPIIKDALEDKNYLPDEYANKKNIESLTKTIQYLEAIKKNVVNIITLQGLEWLS